MTQLYTRLRARGVTSICLKEEGYVTWYDVSAEYLVKSLPPHVANRLLDCYTED